MNFIEKARKTHNNKYDYSKAEYIDSKTKVCIICPEHGEFWQTPHTHLKGYGCNKCSESSLENKLRVILEKNNIKYDYRKHFNWLGKQEIDFFIPDKNIGIECQGEQHYEPIDFFGGLKTFNKIEKNDIKKIEKCNDNEIKLLFFSENKHKTFHGIKSYNDEKILKEIIGRC